MKGASFPQLIFRGGEAHLIVSAPDAKRTLVTPVAINSSSDIFFLHQYQIRRATFAQKEHAMCMRCVNVHNKIRV